MSPQELQEFQAWQRQQDQFQQFQQWQYWQKMQQQGNHTNNYSSATTTCSAPPATNPTEVATNGLPTQTLSQQQQQNAVTTAEFETKESAGAEFSSNATTSADDAKESRRGCHDGGCSNALFTAMNSVTTAVNTLSTNSAAMTSALQKLGQNASSLLGLVKSCSG
jgi:transcription initiation factor TFIID subunit TAF12